MSETDRSPVEYEMVKIEHLQEHINKPDFTWANVNYRAGQKQILSECWGKVGG